MLYRLALVFVVSILLNYRYVIGVHCRTAYSVMVFVLTWVELSASSISRQNCEILRWTTSPHYLMWVRSVGCRLLCSAIPAMTFSTLYIFWELSGDGPRGGLSLPLSTLLVNLTICAI